jgi:hypothetical protein
LTAADGFTQCTALMATQSSREGLAQGMLVLALLWWAWAGYARDERRYRLRHGLDPDPPSP